MTYCTSCAAIISIETTTCPSCGADSRPRCPRCGARAPHDARYCPACGIALLPDQRHTALLPAGYAPFPNERRLVTVLFADIVNSTGLAEALDPEQYHAALTALFRQLASALRDHGAYVEKYVGDSVMAVFGAPKTREDDAARALRASRALHEIADRFADEWSARLGRRLSLRIGVNSGLVIAGRVGEGRPADYGVLGETVNLAARLQAEAQPSETLVGEATRSLVGGRFQFEPLPPRLLPGTSRPALAFLLRDVAVDGARDEAKPMGRDAELAVLDDAIEAMAAGQGVGLALVGEPGAGKTTLLEAARERASGTGLSWVGLTCWSHLRDQPFGALGMLARERAPVVFRPSRKSDVGRIVSPLDTCRALAALAGLMDDRWGAAAVDAIGGFGAGLSTSLENLSSVERESILAERAPILLRALLAPPAVLIVDDAQWLDPASAATIRAARESSSRPAFGCIAAFTPGGRFPGQPDAELTLRPLDREVANHLVTRLLGPIRDSEWLAEDLWQTANGNPGVIVELAGSLTGATDDATPPVLQARLLAELDRLPDEARRVARVAAVASPIIRREAIRALLADEGLDLGSAIETLEANRVLVAEDHGYRFRAAGLARAAAESLLVAERQVLHRRLAEWLLAHQPDDIGPIAHHFLAAGDPRAVESLRRVGDRRRCQGDVEAATTSYCEALAVLERDPSPSEDATESGVALSEALADLGRLPEAFAALEFLDRVVADPPSRMQLACARASIWTRVGELDDATDALNAAGAFQTGLSPDPDARVDRAWRFRSLVAAELHLRLGSFEAAISSAARALASNRSDAMNANDLARDERAYYVLAQAWIGQNDLARAERHLALAAERARREASPAALILHARIATRRGQDHAATELARRAEEAARRVGDRRAEADARELRAELVCRGEGAPHAAALFRAAALAFDDYGDWHSAARCRARARSTASDGA